MTRRSTPQKKIDDRSFPVRLRMQVPPLGQGPGYMTMHAWLKDNIGIGNYAAHAEHGPSIAADLFYFRTAEDARRFVAAFPDLRLKDETRASSYTSPAKGAGLF